MGAPWFHFAQRRPLPISRRERGTPGDGDFRSTVIEADKRTWGGSFGEPASGSIGARLAFPIFLAWTAFGVFLGLLELPWDLRWSVFVAKVIDAWAWALLTPALLLMDRVLTSRESNIGRLVAEFLLLGVPFSLVHTYLSGLLLYPIPEITWGPLRDSSYAVYYFLGGWVTYCTFVAVLQAFKFYDEIRRGQVQLERVERSLAESRLVALRLHLEPHFLFNALNAISSEVAGNPQRARNMIGDLGALLRRSLDCKESAEIALRHELALLEHYLSIQRIRFGDRMDIAIEVEPAVMLVKVPSMLLQPLVENAIRHAIEGRTSGGKIVVSALEDAGHLRIQVSDDGAGLPPAWTIEGSQGHGLRVTRERLSALYPKSGGDSLVVRRGQSGGVEVIIRIPLNREAERNEPIV